MRVRCALHSSLSTRVNSLPSAGSHGHLPASEIRNRIVDGVSGLPYKGILLDQFGVLHDGISAKPAAVEAVKRWAERGTRVYVLSNSSRRAATALERISALGFPRAAFAGAMTSGEVTHRVLSERPGPEWHQLGHTCLHLTWAGRGAIDLGGLGLTRTTHPEEAGFVLAHGVEALGIDGAGPLPRSLDQLKRLLEPCALLGLPMVVANPDIITVAGSELKPMPGMLAEYYATLGGQVRLMGKPDPIIYEAALDELGLNKAHVLAVGDSVRHDLVGAHNAALDSLFVASGIHADAFGDGPLRQDEVAASPLHTSVLVPYKCLKTASPQGLQ